VAKALRGDRRTRTHYTITKAGQLVVALLQESGVYSEYAGGLEWVKERKIA
jgi:hypothetical protein